MQAEYNDDMQKNLGNMFAVKVDSKKQVKRYHLNKDEEVLLQRIKKGECLSYAVSVHRVKSELIPVQIMDRYNKNIEENQYLRTVYRYRGLREAEKLVFEPEKETFSIRDISHEAKAEQVRIVKNVAAAIVRRRFDIEKNKVVLINAFKVSAYEYIVVVARYTWLMPSNETGMGIALRIFGGNSVAAGSDNGLVASDVLKYNEQLHKGHIEYWKEFYGNNAGFLRKSDYMFHDRIKRFQNVRRLIDSAIISNAKEYCAANGISMKALFLAAMSRVYNAKRKDSRFILPVGIDGEVLHSVPFSFESGWNALETCREIDKQFKSHSEHSFVKQSELETIIKGKFNTYFWLYQSFSDNTAIDAVFEKNNNAEILFQNKEYGYLLEINYRIEDDEPSVLYTLGRAFSEAAIEAMHKYLETEIANICAGNGAVKEVVSQAESVESEVTASDNDKLQQDTTIQIAIYLKKSGLFEGISKEDLVSFAKQCTLASYVSDDVVLSSGDYIDSFYIIGSGMLEESVTYTDGYIRSVGISGDNSYIGCESLLEDNTVNTTWTVFSDVAKLVEIPVEPLTELYDKNPQCYRALIARQEQHIDKFRSLWLLD